MSPETSPSFSYETLLALSPTMPERPATVQELRTRLALGTPFNEICDAYFANTSTNGYMEIVGDLYYDTLDNSTPAYDEGQHAEPILVANMVAAHQEHDYIGRTLMQYVPEAKGEQQRRIVLFCNWPEGADTKRVDQTLEVITDFQKAYPEVPLSYCARKLGAGTAIGTIMKMAVDTMLLGARDSRCRDDVMIVLHGADIVSLSPNHLDTLHQRFQAAQNIHIPMVAVRPRVLRERSGGRFPNLDQVVAWSDLLLDHNKASALELGVGVSARGWMLANGPDPTRKLGELHNLLYRIAPADREILRMPIWAPPARLVTASRREWEHLRSSGDPESYWLKAMEMTEHYREIVDDWHDITEEMRDRAVVKLAAGQANSLLSMETDRLVGKGYEIEEARLRAKRTLHLANLILGGPIDEEPWSDFVNKAAERIRLKGSE